MILPPVGEQEDTGPDLPTGRVSIPQHVVHRSFEQETVLLNLETGQYHGLNQVAGKMLAELEETGDPGTVAHRVADEFGVPVERVEADLAQLLAQLRERGLIIVDDD